MFYGGRFDSRFDVNFVDVMDAPKLHRKIVMAAWNDIRRNIRYCEGDVFKTDFDANLPLHSACYYAAPFELIKYIFDRNPEAARLTGEKSLPLHIACRPLDGHASVYVIRMLLLAYPEAASIPDDEGLLPLEIACKHGASIEVLRALLAANVSAVSKYRPHGFQSVDDLWNQFFSGIKRDTFQDNRTEKHRIMTNRKLVEQASSPLNLVSDLGQLWACIEILTWARYYGSIDRPLPFWKKWRVIHALAGSDSHPEILKFALKIFPTHLSERDEDGNLPLHIASSNLRRPKCKGDNCTNRFLLDILVEAFPESAKKRDRSNRLPLHTLLLNQDLRSFNQVEKLLKSYPEAISMKEPITKLYPFMIVAMRKDDCDREMYEPNKSHYGLALSYELLLQNPELVRFGLNY